MNYDNILTDAKRRHDFSILFDVADGNPNGDPDAGNLPRVDPETMHGLVTDVCLKRKVRNWIAATCSGEERMNIYVEHHGVLNRQHQRAYDAEELKSKGTKQDVDTINKARAWMCNNFYDVRSFGAVMTTNINCGQVRGPVQLTFARSIDPIVPLDLSITRVAVTREEDSVKAQQSDEAGSGKVTEMGRKALVPYGLYRAHGFFNPHLASDTGFSGKDLALLWDALQMMWDLDRSASRGMMSLRGLYVFSHDNPLGNAPAHALLDRISISQSDGVAAPRSFSDYSVQVDDTDLPAGITLQRIVG